MKKMPPSPEFLGEVLKNLKDKTNPTFAKFAKKAAGGMEDGDFISMILYGHLMVERYLEGGIDVSLTCPNVACIDRLTFKQKLNLAAGLDIITDKQYRWINGLNKIRNEMAHQNDSPKSKSLIDEFCEGYSWMPQKEPNDLDVSTRKLDGITEHDFHQRVAFVSLFTARLADLQNTIGLCTEVYHYLQDEKNCDCSEAASIVRPLLLRQIEAIKV